MFCSRGSAPGSVSGGGPVLLTGALASLFGLEAVVHQVVFDAVEPRQDRPARIPEAVDALEGLEKDLRGDVFRFGAAPQANVGVAKQMGIELLEPLPPDIGVTGLCPLNLQGLPVVTARRDVGNLLAFQHPYRRSVISIREE